eukprot:305250_1
MSTSKDIVSEENRTFLNTALTSLLAFIFTFACMSAIWITQSTSFTLNGLIIMNNATNDQIMLNKFIDLRVQHGLNNVDIVYNNYYFNKLSINLLLDVLYNNSILFHGDSVLYYQCRYLATLIHYILHYHNISTFQCLNPDKLSVLSLTPTEQECITNYLYIHKKGKWIHTSWPQLILRHLLNYDNFQLKSLYLFAKQMESSLSLNTDEIFYIFTNEIQKNSPINSSEMFNVDIIISNLAATHLLHLFPARKFEPKQVDLLINLELYYDRLIDIALNNNKTKCIIIEGVNPLCDNKIYGQYMTVNEQYQSIQNNQSNQSSHNDLIWECLKHSELNATYTYVKNINSGSIFKLNGIDLCLKYTFNKRGSINLSKRIQLYVMEKQKQLKLINSRLNLFFYDKFKLLNNKCNFTNDGRHYNQILPYQLMTLLNIVNVWC